MKAVYKAARLSRAGILLALCASLFPALPVSAAQQIQSRDIIINSQVVGPPPATPPSIDSPAQGATFEQKQIEVKGSCIAGMIVKIYRNSAFAGSALCSGAGTYGLMIDLYEGRNDLIARQYDNANQASPDSDTVTVYYVPKIAPVLPREDQGGSGESAPNNNNQLPNGGAAGDQTGIAQFQLIIDYDYTLQAIFPDTPFRMPIKFVGGTPPYAISIDWGDGTSDVFSKDATDPFTTDHVYKTPGYYTVKIKVSDKNGQQAGLQFVLLVNGKTTSSFVVAALNASRYLWWWMATGALLIGSWVAAFAIGEAFERRKHKKAK